MQHWCFHFTEKTEKLQEISLLLNMFLLAGMIHEAVCEHVIIIIIIIIGRKTTAFSLCAAI